MTDAGRLVYKTELDTSGYQKGINDIEGKTKSGGSTVKSIITGLGITKLISKAFDVIKSSMDDAINRLDTMRNFSKVMSNLGISAKESDKAIKKLSDGLQGIPTTLDAGALAVQRFTSKNGDVNKSTDLFLALNNAILAGGANMQIQESALEQLSQAYAKGKPDMMEWRTVQMAMPAQLKQIATQMLGNRDSLELYLKKAREYANNNPLSSTANELVEQLEAVSNGTGDMTTALGTALRTGVISMDEFMDTISYMNKNGSKQFKSFEKQSRNATGGIRTNITNMKTAVVRGVANMIDEFDKLLKNKGLGGLGALITKVGKTAEKVLKDSVKWMAPVVDITLKLIDVLIKFSPVILGVVTAITTYKVAMGLATTATNLFTKALSLNPVGLAVAGIVAVTTALVAYTEQASKVDSKTKEISESLQNYKNTMEDVAKRRQETLNVNMQEVYGYQSLYEELQKITDENGKVKEGYEERARVIGGQLSESLGIEFSMIGNVIKNYQDLKTEINDTIEYKKAMAYFNAHEEEYNEAVRIKTELQKDYNKALDNRDKKQDTYHKNLKKYAKELNISAESLEAYVNQGKQAQGMYKDLDNAILGNNDLLNGVTLILRDNKKAMEDANTTVENAGKAYTSNQEIIYNYGQAQQAIADKNYEAVYKIYNDTVTFNGKTKEANNKKYEEEKEAQTNYLLYLEQNKDKYDEGFIKNENERVGKYLEALDKEKEEANKKIDEKNKKISATTLTGINDQLKIFKDNQYKFEDAGNGNVQLYIDGFSYGEPVALEKASKLATDTVEQIKNEKMSAEEAGQYLIDGVTKGISNKIKQNDTFRAVSSFANKLLGALKSGLNEQSPSKASKQYGEWLLEGLNIGIDNEKKDVLDNIEDFSDDVVNRMASAVNMQAGKMAFSGTSGTVNQILTATGTTTVINENKLLLDGDVVYENQKKVSAKKDLQTQFGGAYSVSN